MDIATIKRYIDEGQVEFVKIGAPDIEGVYRGKRVLARYFLNALEDGSNLATGSVASQIS